MRSALICLVNVQRRARHLKPLRANVALNRVAQAHDGEMVAHNYASHIGLDGSDSIARIVKGYVRSRRNFATGEDIGFGDAQRDTPRDIVNGWMRSPVHRANVLRAAFREGGVGVVPSLPVALGIGTEGAIYTLDFGFRT